MIWKPSLQLKIQHITCSNALSFDNSNSSIKTLLSNSKMHANYVINIMDHLGLSNDVENQVFHVII
jgi:hypothetical protein